jgi:hypothetical protein
MAINFNSFIHLQINQDSKFQLYQLNNFIPVISPVVLEIACHPSALLGWKTPNTIYIVAPIVSAQLANGHVLERFHIFGFDINKTIKSTTTSTSHDHLKHTSNFGFLYHKHLTATPQNILIQTALLPGTITSLNCLPLSTTSPLSTIPHATSPLKSPSTSPNT